MPIDFTLPPDIQKHCEDLRGFIRDEVIPLEADKANYDPYENIKLDVLDGLRAKAKARGLWAPQMPKDRGGMELPMTGWAAFYEEANYSIFGPFAVNCAAPDDGNMNVLNKVGTEAQKEKWLQPIIDGDVRSSFIMTEPHPGSGSDPTMMLTTAEKKGGKYVVNGHKWFITGAEEAAHFILIARTSDDTRRGLSAFAFHKDDPGWEIIRRIEIMGPEEHGGHCELKFNGLEIPEENLLMEEGDGLRLTQIRLGPARLTHCMRWLGLAKRCMEIAAVYVAEREGFGVKLADRESVQIAMGKIAHQIHIGRLLVMHAAWKLDQGDLARKEVSMAKNHVADTLHNAADTAVQLQGAKGYSKDTIAEWIYRYCRQGRLVDGASEVHQMVMNRFYQKEGLDYWKWGV